MNFHIFRFANLHVMQYPATFKYITGIDNVKGFGLNVVPKNFWGRDENMTSVG
jgi:hypothetical protein